jgi:LacI family repressor for deo operon, udp, cdd, tsx, nupC, and nupG
VRGLRSSRIVNFFSLQVGECELKIIQSYMKNKELTGIRLIADKLGVSTATISRALSPETSHLVKEERRKEILELADKMRYRPNPGARLIQRGINPTIGVLIPGEEDVFFSEFYGRFMGGMIQAIKDTDWEVRINALKGDCGNVLDEFRRIGLGCSGLIYAGHPLTTEEMDHLSQYHSPLILLSSVIPPDYPIEKVGCHVLGVDNYNGAIAASKYIAQQGHKRIGLIVGPEESRDFSERTKGYIEGLRQAKIKIADDMIFQASYDQESGRAGCEYFLGKDSVPTALICASDNIAFGVLDYAKDHGVSCPKDVSIIGFDDGPWAIACSPKLTTVRQPLGALTARAVEIIMQTVADTSADHRQRVNLAAVLNIRESTSYARS